MNLKGYKSMQNSRISDDMDEQNSVDREVELLQDLYSDYTDDLEEMRSNYANGREDTATVEDWEQAYRALIDEIRGLDIENPQEVHDTLVDWNWHRLTWCMCLAGKLGQGELNEAVKWLGKYAYDDKSYLALKNIANNDFGGSRVGDSRRVKDSRKVSDADLNYYGWEDNGGYYGEDFETTDEDWDEVIGLMNGYLELEEQYNIDYNDRKTPVKRYKEFYYAVMDMAENFSFSNPEYIDNELTEANYHTLNRCITIAGLLGEEQQQRLVNSWVRDLKNIREYMQLARQRAFTEIMQEMGLI